MKPDWKDAPGWATMLMQNNINSDTYCWVDSSNNKAVTSCGFTFNFSPFKSFYHLVDARPIVAKENINLPKVGDKLLYSLGQDIWYECEIKYVVPLYGVVALCQPVGGSCEQWLDTTTKFKPIPLTEEDKYKELLHDVSQYGPWEKIADHLYKLGYHK